MFDCLADLGLLLDFALNGIVLGSILALAAIGLSLVFGTTGLSNFAHAELITFGALMALTFSTVVALPLWLALLIALIRFPDLATPLYRIADVVERRFGGEAPPPPPPAAAPAADTTRQEPRDA